MTAFRRSVLKRARLRLQLTFWIGATLAVFAVLGPASTANAADGSHPRESGSTLLRVAQATPSPTQVPPADNRTAALRDQIRQALRLYQAGRCVDAIPLAKATADAIRTQHGGGHPDLVAAINVRALCHKALGQYQEAEPLYREAIQAAEAVYGAESTEAAIMIDNLAGLYFEQQRLVQAEPLRRRALEIFLKATGPESINTLTSTQNLGALLYAKGQHADAERHYRQALAIADKVFKPDDPQKGKLLDNLAGAVRSQGRIAEAGPLYERAIAIFETSLGAEHPDTAIALQNHAILLAEVGAFAESERQLERALAIHEKNYGSNHPVLVVALSTLANGYIDQGRWSDAVTTLRRAVEALAQRRALEADDSRGGVRNEQKRYSTTYRKLVQALLHAAPDDRAALDEAFRMAQIALDSEASIAISQMTARFAASDPQIAGFLRERQDLVAEADALDRNLISAAGRRKEARNAAQEDASRSRITQIQARVREIDRVLARDFPGYAALANPQPLGIEQAQRMLRADESLVVTLDVPQIDRSPDESFVIVVTRETARWAAIPLGDAGLEQAVHALRCGLDVSHWAMPGCQRLLGHPLPKGPLPFDVERAHRLYRAIFGGIEDQIRGRHLLFVAAGALTKLPVHVLVTEPPAVASPTDSPYRGVAWLARRQPISVLPSVAGLKGLRSLAKASRAPSPMIGFGNPLLTGADGTDRSAWSKATCADVPVTLPGAASPHVIAHAPAAATLFRGALTNVDAVRRQVPLPETADELCAVARSVGAEPSAIKLGAQATEAAVKDLSRTGDLARHGIVHFATHGLVAGDLPRLAEPALMLTPPDRASEEDDGLLTASEITQLKLDADWVIMSACNTAAGEAAHADALSGLARSFFYAGARSLLVSHWAVNSNATVRLITTAVEGMKTDPTIGRAEALRRAMLAMIERGTPDEAHPSSWAPFVLVGEGAGLEALATGGVSPPPAGDAAAPVAAPATAPRKATSKQAPPQKTAPKNAPDDWQSRVFRQ